jgi:hypothetical protein
MDADGLECAVVPASQLCCLPASELCCVLNSACLPRVQPLPHVCTIQQL